jgi:hypothetical protein
MMYYLPEYQVVRLDPIGHSMLIAQWRSQGSWAPVGDCLSGNTRDAVWVVMTPYEPGIVPDSAHQISPQAGPFQVWALTPAETPVDYLGFTIVTSC